MSAPGSPSARRLFFALWPEPGWARQLLAQSAACPGETCGAGGGAGRAVAMSDLHVTLCFLGAVEAAVEQALRAGADTVDAPAVELQFDRLEYWPRSRVLVAAALPSASANRLAQALAALAARVGLTPDRHAFRPHLTLARGVCAAPADYAAAGPRGPVAQDEIPARPLARTLIWTALRMDLACSEPAGTETAGRPRYRRLQCWPLRGSAGG